MCFVRLVCNMFPEVTGDFLPFLFGVFFCFPGGINFVWLEQWAL